MDDETRKKVLVRKILVAIDTSKHSQAALKAAASLARIMEANIHGVFVHDEVWNRVSRLPSVTSVNSLTGQVSAFKDETMQDRVQILENRLRQKLKEISQMHDITHSWQLARGKVGEEILNAARETDLITIGLKGTTAQRKILGSSARRIIDQADKPVLLLKEGLNLGSTITAVFDGSIESKKGLKLALDLAERNESTLTILMIENDVDSQEGQKNEISNLLRGSTIFPEIKQLDRSDPSRFINSVNLQKTGLLIIPKKQPLLTNSLQVILNHINCPLLMMN
ncbi:MAG: universal stress protein [Bacteroidetes bacterium]|jgi:nucleotide-binding universal stress UspA family protein|nr:universal stress protein [Bacteroidota bacterium]